MKLAVPTETQDRRTTKTTSRARMPLGAFCVFGAAGMPSADLGAEAAHAPSRASRCLGLMTCQRRMAAGILKAMR